KKSKKIVLPFLSVISSCLYLACATSIGGQGQGYHQKDPDIRNQFTNPVFEPILADPTVLRDPVSGVFYAYGTQDDWGDGAGSRLVPVLKSKDLSKWEL